MKSRILGVSLGSSIFILLLVAVLALVRPVYLRIHKALSELEAGLYQRLERETGLSLSYQSMSPSVLVGVSFRNISLHEVETKSRVAGIRRARLSYDVTGFFSKNPRVAFKELSLNGVTIDYDAVKNVFFVEKIKNLVRSREDAEDSSGDAGGGDISASWREFDIPFDVSAKNVSIHYSDAQNDVLVGLRTLRLKDYNVGGGIEVRSAGRLFYKTALFKIDEEWSSFACNFSVSGAFFPNFDGSAAFVSFSGAGGADYSISRLDMLFNYSDLSVEVRTMRTALPFSVFARYDIQEEMAELTADFDYFNPFRLISIRRKNPVIQKIDGTTLSGTLSGKIGGGGLSYKSDISIDLSENVVGERVALVLKCDGDGDNVSVERLGAYASFVDGDFSGSLNIGTLQPSGILNLNYFVLENGGIISTEVYIDHYRNGFTCVAPQIFMNEKSFTGVQFTALPGGESVDFQFELLDFAHPDFEETGRLRIEGSFLGNDRTLQAGVVLSNIFADSIIDTAAFFMPNEKSDIMRGLAGTARPYVFNSEAYLWSDFKDFSLLAPVNILANTEKDRQLLIFALDGSNETAQLSDLDLIFGNQSAHADVSIEFSDTFREFTFTSDFAVNSVPYHFFGNFSPDWILVSGDYDFDAVVSIDEQIGATLRFNQLPFAVGKFVFSASTSSILRWNQDSGLGLEILSLEFDEPSANLHLNPHLLLSGSMNRYGFDLTSFAYSDDASSLDGNGSVIINMNDDIFDSMRASLSAQNLVSSESISLTVDLSNPGGLPFSADAVRNNFYISAQAFVRAFPSSRLLDFQNPENRISADLMLSGTPGNPFVSMTLHDSSFLLYGYPLLAEGFFSYDDTGAHIENLSLDWAFAKISDVRAFFDPYLFSGEASFTFDANLMEKTLHAPFAIELESSVPEKKFSVPDYFSLSLKTDKVSGDFIKSDFPLTLIATRSPGRFDIITDVADGFHASYDESGLISMGAGKKSPVQFNLEGRVAQDDMNLNIDGIVADMGFICSELEIPFVHFNAGKLDGELRITGPTTDPEYTGFLSVTRPNFTIPLISKSYFSADKVIMTVEQGEAVVPATLASLGKGQGIVEFRMEFNRWIPNFLELKINIDDNRKVPLDLVFPFVHASGLASGNLELSFAFPRDLSVSGSVVADNTDVEIVATPLQEQFSLKNLTNFFPSLLYTEKTDDLNVTVDFDIVVGQKVQLLFNPFLRGVVAPGTPLHIYFDTYTGDFQFKSDINLRGGEITWLNRNFYMKEGRIVFNENQDSMDPKVTVRAETRARDENGNMVTITLSANEQRVSVFNPAFSANPARSEREIMSLLGQIVAADSGGAGEMSGAIGDMFLQSTVIRRIENTLRELLNFDIVSIRTNVLQNSVRLSMDEKSDGKQLTVGNFIDNSTVYVGKYFGSSIYVDSMLHWTYDEHKVDNGTSANGIVFQPEIGFEMASPFVNIRLGVAPDIDSLQRGLLDTWVPSTSMTLSWKFAF